MDLYIRPIYMNMNFYGRETGFLLGGGRCEVFTSVFWESERDI